VTHLPANPSWGHGRAAQAPENHVFVRQKHDDKSKTNKNTSAQFQRAFVRSHVKLLLVARFMRMFGICQTRPTEQAQLGSAFFVCGPLRGEHILLFSTFKLGRRLDQTTLFAAHQARMAMFFRP